MKSGTLSVVTVTFNNYEELVATLQSIPPNPQVESVVINGGNCEKTKELLKTRNINHLSEKDEGISDAFNKGIQQSHGEFIVFLNSGDLLIDANYYTEALRIFATHLDIDFVYADIVFRHKDHGDLVFKPSNEAGKVPYPHPSLIVRRKIFEQVGGFDKSLKLAMDYDLIQRMLQIKAKGYYYQNAAVVLMDGTGASSKNGVRGLQERELILRRYNLMTAEAADYFKKLRFKMQVRGVLEKLHLDTLYDRCKKIFIQPRSE